MGRVGRATLARSPEFERENLRAALAWLSECGATQQCLRLVGDLRGLWFHLGHMSEARTQLASVLALPGAEQPTAARAHALAAAGVVAIFSGESARSIPLNEESLAIYQALDERAPQPWLFIALGLAAEDLGQSDRAAQYWSSLALARELGDRVNAARALVNLSELSVDSQDFDRRETMAEEALALARAAGYAAPIQLCLTRLIRLAFSRNDFRSAAEGLQETLVLSTHSSWQWQLTGQLDLIAHLAHATGQPASATQLMAAHDALRERTGMHLSAVDRAQHDQFLTDMRAAMAGETYAAAWDGRPSMPREDDSP